MPTKHRVNLSFPNKTEHEEMQKLANQLGISFSEAVRQGLQLWKQQQQQQQPQHDTNENR